MWNKATAAMPAQGQSNAHSHAAVMAHVAHQRARAAKVLSGQVADAPAPNGFQDTLAQQAGVKVPDVQTAIDGLAKQGHFTPAQAAALKAHKGPLHGQPGANTQKTILQALIQAKAGPMPGPAAPGALQLSLPPGVQAPAPPPGAPLPQPPQGM